MRANATGGRRRCVAQIRSAVVQRSWQGARARPWKAKRADTWLCARCVEWFHEWFRVVECHLPREGLIEIITYVAAAWKSKLALGL